MIEFTCPHCGKAFRVKDEAAGKQGKCPACQETVEVPGRQAATQVAEPAAAQAAPPPVQAVPAAAAPSAAAAAVAPSAGNPLAVAGLVLGILAIPGAILGPLDVVIAILALIFGMLGLRKAKKARTSKGMAVTGIALGAVGLVLAAIASAGFIAALGFARGEARRATSMANLNMIGKVVMLYQAENAYTAPPDLDTLVRDTLIQRKRLTYPGLNSGRDSDYFYLPPQSDYPGEAIIVCEFKDCTNGKQHAYLQLDGAVRSVSEEEFQQLRGLCKENEAFFRALQAAEGS
jgi:predicted Zn finger-like uncharacterized protein